MPSLPCTGTLKSVIVCIFETPLSVLYLPLPGREIHTELSSDIALKLSALGLFWILRNGVPWDYVHVHTHM